MTSAGDERNTKAVDEASLARQAHARQIPLHVLLGIEWDRPEKGSRQAEVRMPVRLVLVVAERFASCDEAAMREALAALARPATEREVAQWLQSLGPFDLSRAVPAPAPHLAPENADYKNR